MDTAKLVKLIAHYKRINDSIKEREAAFKADIADDKAMLVKIQEKLLEFIHKEEGGIQKLSLPDGSATAYSRYEDQPKMQDRDEVEDWIIGDTKMSKAAREGIKERMSILGNTLIKDVVTNYRIDSGALEENGLLEGGSLPPGVGLFRRKEVRVVKSK